MLNRRQSLIGKKFGHLTVIAKSNKRGKANEVYWICQCDCGKVIEANTSNLTGHRMISCGHYRSERMKKYSIPEETLSSYQKTQSKHQLKSTAHTILILLHKYQCRVHI